jgi:hypothetical protein
MFRVGQKVKLVKGDKALERLGFRSGDIVVVSGNENGGLDGDMIGVKSLDGTKATPSCGWYAWRFEAVPEGKLFEPKFRKGQKLLVVDASPSIDRAPYSGCPFKNGDIVVASEDSYVDGPMEEEVRINGISWIARRFEVAPKDEVKPFTPTFKRGAWLRLKDADGQTFLKAGEIVKASRASYLGVDGKELVDFLDNDGYARVFYASRFAAEAHPEFPPETYLVIQTEGSSWQTCDLNEVDDGETVAIYKLERVGTSKKSVVTVE